MENKRLTKTCKPTIGQSLQFCRLILPFFVVISAMFLYGCRNGYEEPANNPMPDSLALKTGDLVFRTGRSVASRSVTATDTGCIYSHVGMIVPYGRGWGVLHAVPNERESRHEKDSVKLEPVSLFFSPKRAVHGAVLRFSSLTDDDRLALCRKGLSVYRRHPLFDSSFNADDSSAFYCTELVWFIYLNAINIDLTRNRRHTVPLLPPLIFCSDIISCPGLEKVFIF
jgi:hypothetical protein